MLRTINGNKIRKNEIMVTYRCKAYLADGIDKLNLIGLICTKDSSEVVYNFVKALFKPIEEDIYNLVINICDDVIKGMSALEIEKKKYGYTYEEFYYVDKEYFNEKLKHDPHYSEMKIFKF